MAYYFRVSLELSAVLNSPAGLVVFTYFQSFPLT